MRSAISWMTVLALLLAACGVPTTGDEAAEAPPTTQSGEAAQSAADDDVVVGEGDGPETVEDDPTPTGTNQRSQGPSVDDSSIEKSVEPVGESGSTDAREDSADQRGTKQPERVADEPASQPLTGEVPPETMTQVMGDLSSRTGIPVSEFTVVRAEAVVWNDGSLGCPQPGMTYTMALVDGYWIEIDHGGTIHDYRASAEGFFTYCEGGGIGPLNPDA